MTVARFTVADLLRVMQRLREPDTGCPWDLEQDFKSIAPSTLEECYELVQAIEEGDYEHVGEELGDVLFQVVFYAQLGREQNLFSFDTIVSALVEKLIRRHPHVFFHAQIEGKSAVRSSVDEVKRTWEEIKQLERNTRSQSGAMADIPLALPALSRAQKVQKRAAQLNFDWKNAQSVVDKLQEELDELRQAISLRESSAIADEIGDVLFTCVNLARHLDQDAEKSLRGATNKFERRFRIMETLAAQSGIDLASLDEARFDALWRQAKGILIDT